MKILVIDACARKGNTWKLTEAVISEIKNQISDIQIEEVVLARENIPFCCGCSNCFRLGMEKCPHYSIIGEISRKIEEADGIIVCSSTFNMRETGYLKNFLDHYSSMLHRPYFYRQKALVITTAGGMGQVQAAKSIEATLLGIGFNKCYRIAIAATSYNAYVPSDKDLARVRRTVSDFTKDVESGKYHKPKYSLLIPYNLMRGMGQSYGENSEYPTEDGNWWMSPERSKRAYFEQVRLTPFQKLFGQIFYLMGKRLGSMDSMKVTYRK